MKKYLLFFLLSFFYIQSHSQIFDYAWHHHLEGTSYESYADIVVMDNNDLILYGTLSTAADVDPADQSGYFLNASFGKTFISRISGNGDLIWVVQFDSLGELQLREMSRDAAGDIYICGYFSGAVDMDPGNDTVMLYNTGGVNDAFFAKYSGQDGQLIWARAIGSNQNDEIIGICAVASGHTFITGNFQSTLDFDPGAGIFTLPIATPTTGCLAEYDAQGNFVGAYGFGTTVATNAYDIVVDVHDRIYFWGSFSDTTDFDPGAGIFNLTGTNSDGFLIKFTNTMQLLNGIAFNGTAAFSKGKLQLDPLGNIVAGGTVFAGTIDFDGSADTAFVTTIFNSTIITRQDSMLQYLSAWTLQGSGYSLTDFGSDSDGNVFLLITLSGSMDADPGPGTVTYNAINGNNDVVIGRYSPGGQYLWSVKIGNGGDDSPRALAITGSNKLLYASLFISLLDIDPGPDTILVKVITGSTDAYIAAFDFCTPPVTAVNPVICKGQSYTVGSHTFTESGDFEVRLNSTSGCDSIVQVHLTVVSPVTTVSVSDTTITSNALNASYQWINCESSAAAGSGQSIQVSGNDGYAVEVTQNGCIDTSSCIRVYQNANSQHPQFAWGHIIPFYDYCHHHMTHISKAGNIFVAGSLDDSSNFELLGGRGQYFRGDPAYQMICVVKYDENLNYLWGIAFGTPVTQVGQNFPDIQSMTVDDDENVYIAGSYSDSIDVDPTPGMHVLASGGLSGAFLLKFNASGQLQWADNIPHNGSLEMRTLLTDKSGHVYIGGGMTGTATVISGSGSTTLNASGSSSSLMLIQFNTSNGNYVGHFLPPGGAFDESKITGATCDNDSNILLTGFFEYTIDFDPGAGVATLTPFLNGSPDGFVVKYTPSMQYLWARKRNAITSYTNFSVVADGDNNVYVSGAMPYLYKYDSAGTFKKDFPVSGQGLIPRDMAIDELNNIFVYYQLYDAGGTLGTDTFAAVNAGYDIVVAKFRNDGHYDWGMQLASISTETPASIATDRKGNLYFSGTTNGTLDADISSNTHDLVPNYYSTYLIKYGQTCAAVDTAVFADSLHISAADTNSYYQWIFCNTGAIIPGANSYLLPEGIYGDVRVIIYQGECIDTSGCYFSSSTTGIDSNCDRSLSAFPNPSSHSITISFTPDIQPAELLIYNLQGKEMERKEIFPGEKSHLIHTALFPPGIYTVVLRNKTGSGAGRFVVE